MLQDISFFDKVYQVTALIPYGRVTSYGAIARYLGSGRSARMVGWALNASHAQTPMIPAHRVVNRNGLLSGKHHFGTYEAMKELLESEGIKVVNDQVLEFKKLFWDPVTELEAEFR
ncbi:MAG: MGMT family protein [Bacteroidota bacterium]